MKMFKRLELASVMLLAVVAATSAGTLSCGGTAQESGTIGTETGNPPLLDRLRLRLEVRAYDVEIIGEPGAVSPGGATVTARNLSTGETRSVTAAADGSFRVALPGGLEDGYEVTVSAGGMDTSAGVDVPSEGTPIGGDGEGQPGACDATAILVRSCGAAGCHGAGSGFSAFAADESAPLDFVNVAGTGSSCMSEGFIIDSEAPERSLILTKLAPVTPCGAPMPLGSTLPEPEIACIASWLEGFRE